MNSIIKCDSLYHEQLLLLSGMAKALPRSCVEFVGNRIALPSYAATYQNSQQRRDALGDWLHHYNWHRPHTALLGSRPSPAGAVRSTGTCQSD